MNELTKQSIKLREIFHKKYMEEFPVKNNWEKYVNSIGCHRSEKLPFHPIVENKDKITFECPSNYNKTSQGWFFKYKTHYIIVPKELALKILTLGTLPIISSSY
jgi:hypothetical protein